MFLLDFRKCPGGGISKEEYQFGGEWGGIKGTQFRYRGEKPRKRGIHYQGIICCGEEFARKKVKSTRDTKRMHAEPSHQDSV